MRYINKQVEPARFAQWKLAHPRATYDNDLCGNSRGARRAKRDLKASLLAEQKYICCYCECRVIDANSHIEHFRPKDANMFPHLQLDYNNLFVSCIKNPPGGVDIHCGHRKGNFFSTDLVSPLESDCASHFTYMMDGTIYGSDTRGCITRDKLHLDSELLNTRRKLLIDSFLICEEDELQAEIDAHLDVNAIQLEEFFTMIDYLHSSGQL